MVQFAWGSWCTRLDELSAITPPAGRCLLMAWCTSRISASSLRKSWKSRLSVGRGNDMTKPVEQVQWSSLRQRVRGGASGRAVG